MKAATLKEIKLELKECSQEELLDYCLRLSRFKKENKELLTYLLFESANEAGYIESVKSEIEEEFKHINKTSVYYIKKSVRKILRYTKKYIRYSKKKETEVELLIYYCNELLKIKPSIKENKALKNLYQRQIESIKKALSTLHEDLQYDFEMELEALM